MPVLLSSGLTAEDNVLDLLSEGATAFMPKPFGIGQLTQAVSLAIRETPPLLH